jgi:integrase
MMKYNARNERIKKEYFRYLSEAKGKSPATLDGIRKSLRRYEEYNRLKDFSPLHREQAIAFKKDLASQKAERGGEPFSKSTVLSTLNHIKAFFEWLAYQPDNKRKIHLPDIGYFSLSDKETRIAKTPKYKRVPTLEQIRRVLAVMPTDTDIALRNRAVIAFTILTGVRDSALISLKLRHIHLDEQLVVQDPADVKTKFSKRIDTYFLPVGDDIKQIVLDWIRFLYEKKLYGHEAPLFPRTRMAHDETQGFIAAGLEPAHWQTTGSVREIFREAFTKAELPYYNPHSFRDTLVQVGYKQCNNNLEALKAWSQNLGHESMLTTLTSYGTFSTHRQGQVINELSRILLTNA